MRFLGWFRRKKPVERCAFCSTWRLIEHGHPTNLYECVKCGRQQRQYPLIGDP